MSKPEFMEISLLTRIDQGDRGAKIEATNRLAREIQALCNNGDRRWAGLGGLYVEAKNYKSTWDT